MMHFAYVIPFKKITTELVNGMIKCSFFIQKIISSALARQILNLIMAITRRLRNCIEM
jgi:hypothetical protein